MRRRAVVAGMAAGLPLVPVGYSAPGMGMANDAGMGALTGPQDLERANKLVRESGSAGARMLVMGAADSPLFWDVRQS